MEPPPDIVDGPFGVAAFHIYAQSWQTPELVAETVQNASRELCQVIVDSGDKEEAVYCSIRALHKFACKSPPALDHALDVMAQGYAQLPEDTELLAIKGPEGALLILKWWLVDWSQRFKGSPYGDDGSEENRRAPSDAHNTKDGTNVFFEQSEVSNSIDSVLEKNAKSPGSSKGIHRRVGYAGPMPFQGYQPLEPYGFSCAVDRQCHHA